MTRITKQIGLGAGITAMALALGAGAFAAAQDQSINSRGRRGGPPSFQARGAQDDEAGRPRPMARMAPRLDGLGLTDAQQEQVRTIVRSHEADVTATLERGRAAREALQTAVTADTIDEPAIRARSAEVAAIEADLAVSRARVRSDVLQTLTPEQRAVFNLREAQRAERGPRGRNGRAGGPPSGPNGGPQGPGQARGRGGPGGPGSGGPGGPRGGPRF
jgi:Spy/CpxP family protein refolding chaperone